MGALAAAVGFSQADVSKLSEAFANGAWGAAGAHVKPKVIWVHGAECTGCSTSLLGILESPGGHPIYSNTSIPTYGLAGATTETAVVTLAQVTPAGSITGASGNLFSLWTAGGVNAIEGSALVNIADVVIDVIDLQYHETIMPMGGDLAAQWLHDFAGYTPTVGGSNPGDPHASAMPQTAGTAAFLPNRLEFP